jgi:hypothetical protein
MRDLGPLEAHIVAGRLNAEGVPTLVLEAWRLHSTMRAEILVPRHLMHRANWVMAWPPVSEAELVFLATGEIGPVDEAAP